MSSHQTGTDSIIPPGGYWSGRIPRNADDPSERYNAGDTMKIARESRIT